MGYRILADETVQRRVCEHLSSRGHDVEMVVDVLEPGVDDEFVLQYARRTDRVVLTADTDFITTSRPTLFQPDDRLPSFRVAEIVDEISKPDESVGTTKGRESGRRMVVMVEERGFSSR